MTHFPTQVESPDTATSHQGIAQKLAKKELGFAVFVFVFIVFVVLVWGRRRGGGGGGEGGYVHDYKIVISILHIVQTIISH